MKRPSIIIGTLAITLLVIPYVSQAESWSCKLGNSVREIHIQTESPNIAAPCSVVYKKPTEGKDDQTLWTATNDAGYCAEKAKAFVQKQVSWGWTCEEAAGESSAPQTAK